MQLWRLYRQAHGPGLDGMGGRYTAGRWHRLGTPVVYFGMGAAIVVLEKLAHLNPDALPEDLMLAQFAGELSVEDAAPRNVHDMDESRELGERWSKRKSSCVLRVPSVLVPEESNLVLNPTHEEAARLKWVDKRPFVFDGRLL